MTEPSKTTPLLILDDDPTIGATIALMAQSSQVECRFTSVAREFFAELDTWQPPVGAPVEDICRGAVAR